LGPGEKFTVDLFRRSFSRSDGWRFADEGLYRLRLEYVKEPTPQIKYSCFDVDANYLSNLNAAAALHLAAANYKFRVRSAKEQKK